MHRFRQHDRSFLRAVRAFHRDRAPLLNPIPPETIDHLRLHGYAVLDDSLPKETCAALLSESHALLSTPHAARNHTQILRVRADGSRVATPVAKSAVTQAELSTLSPTICASDYPTLWALHTDSALAAQASVFWPRLTLKEQSVKTQTTAADGAFPIHVDADSASRDARVVTAIIYPHADWDSSLDAGALRVYPTPMSHIDITPAPGRLILLSSRNLHHRVLSSRRVRTAVTVWLSGSLRSPGQTPPADLPALPRIAYELLTPRFRDAVFKLILQGEWMQSLRESHNVDAADELVANFEMDIDLIKKRLPAVIATSIAEDQCKDHEVNNLIENPDNLRSAFQDLAARMDRIPFLW